MRPQPGESVINEKSAEYLRVLRASYFQCSGHGFIEGDAIRANRDIILHGGGIPQGSTWRVFDAAPGSFEIGSVDAVFPQWRFEEDDAPKMWRDFDIAASEGTSASRPSARTITADEQEKQMDFFFPKSTLPKPRPGGGGFLGVPTQSRNPFRRR